MILNTFKVSSSYNNFKTSFRNAGVLLNSQPIYLCSLYNMTKQLQHNTMTAQPTHSLSQRLEAYTLKHPQEVLLISVQAGDIEDQILIFKGFSSSLMHPTDFNPDRPILSETATIMSIDRLASPYNPNQPQYIEQNLSLAQMQQRLQAVGLA